MLDSCLYSHEWINFFLKLFISVDVIFSYVFNCSFILFYFLTSPLVLVFHFLWISFSSESTWIRFHLMHHLSFYLSFFSQRFFLENFLLIELSSWRVLYSFRPIGNSFDNPYPVSFCLNSLNLKVLSSMGWFHFKHIVIFLNDTCEVVISSILSEFCF